MSLSGDALLLWHPLHLQEGLKPAIWSHPPPLQGLLEQRNIEAARQEAELQQELAAAQAAAEASAAAAQQQSALEDAARRLAEAEEAAGSSGAAAAAAQHQSEEAAAEMEALQRRLADSKAAQLRAEEAAAALGAGVLPGFPFSCCKLWGGSFWAMWHKGACAAPCTAWLHLNKSLIPTSSWLLHSSCRARGPKPVLC